MMKVQVNTDHNIKGREELDEYVESKVTDTLGHLAAHITRVEVHLSDENANHSGHHDKRCMMEARLEGHQPLAVSDDAETISQAIDGAAEKLKHSLDHTLGRLKQH